MKRSIEFNIGPTNQPTKETAMTKDFVFTSIDQAVRHFFTSDNAGAREWVRLHVERGAIVIEDRGMKRSIEFNIGCNVNGKPTLTRTNVVQIVSGLFSQSLSLETLATLKHSISVGEWEGVKEETVCFSIETNKFATPLIERMLGELAFYLRQDCIAMVTVSKSEYASREDVHGVLIGPTIGTSSAVNYDFDIRFFNRFEA